MSAQIIPFMTDAGDITLTQFIDKYLEMELEEARTRIMQDWKPQMVVLLMMFITFAKRHNKPYCLPVQLTRGDGSCGYITFLCRCSGRPIMGGAE